MSQGAGSGSMPVRVDVHADERAGPGWAHLRVSGLKVSSAQALGDIRDIQFSLQRNQDSRYLAERGEWSPSEVWHRSQSVSVTDDGLDLLMGPDLVDELLVDPRAVYRVHLRQAAQSWSGVMRMARGVYPSGATGHVPDASRQVQTPASMPAVAAQDVAQDVVPQSVESIPDTAPDTAPVTEPGTDKPGRSKKPLLLLVMVLLLALIGAVIVYLTWFRQPVEPPRAEPGSGSGAGAAPPCSLQAMQAVTDDLQFLQSCVQTRPDTKAVMTVIAAGKQAGRCDLIQRLYAHQAQAGNAEVAVSYAREFDPQTFAGGCFKEPDAATALYWYDAALKLEPGRTDVVARVNALEAMK